MSVSKPLTYQELLELSHTPMRRVYWRLDAVVIVDGQPTKNLRVVGQHIQGNFNSRYYPDHIVTLEVDVVSYRYMLQHTNKIEVELTKIEQSADGLKDKEVIRKTQRYKGHLTETVNPALVSASGRDAQTATGVERISQMQQIHIQLVEPIISDLRMEETGGVFKDVTVDELLKVLLGYKLNPGIDPSVFTDPLYVQLRGVDVIQPDNTERYKHIVIPNGTRLTHLPRYLQDNYGIYSTGLGWHIYRGWCFIYPLMNNREFNHRKKTITVLNVPEDEIPTMERSYLYRSEQLYVFATGDKAHVDITERIQLNQGHGLRMSKASDLLDRFRDISSNKVTFNQKDRVQAFLLDERPDQKANVRFIENHFTDNPFPETSRMSSSLGTEYQMQWDNAAPELLYPGMQAKILYKEEDSIRELYGNLVGIEVTSRPTTDQITDRHFITRVKMTFFIHRLAEVSI